MSPDSYSADTESAVRYLPVTRHGEVIGYLWASETNDGMSFQRRVIPEQDTLYTTLPWSKRLDEAYADGLPPLLALHRWTGLPEDAEAGTIVEGAVEQRAGSLRELEELANPGLVDSFDYEEAIRDRSQGWDGLSPMTLNRPGYSFLTEGPVRCVPVILNGLLLGYLWASESEQAAAFLKRTAAGSAGYEAQAPWFVRLEADCKEGLAPVEALRRWTGAPQDPVAGAIPADADERIASSLHDLEELAEG